jgi:hypothetical protein
MRGKIFFLSSIKKCREQRKIERRSTRGITVWESNPHESRAFGGSSSGGDLRHPAHPYQYSKNMMKEEEEEEECVGEPNPSL